MNEPNYFVENLIWYFRNGVRKVVSLTTWPHMAHAPVDDKLWCFFLLFLHFSLRKCNQNIAGPEGTLQMRHPGVVSR